MDENADAGRGAYPSAEALSATMVRFAPCRHGWRDTQYVKVERPTYRPRPSRPASLTNPSSVRGMAGLARQRLRRPALAGRGRRPGRPPWTTEPPGQSFVPASARASRPCDLRLPHASPASPRAMPPRTPCEAGAERRKTMDGRPQPCSLRTFNRSPIEGGPKSLRERQDSAQCPPSCGFVVLRRSRWCVAHPTPLSPKAPRARQPRRKGLLREASRLPKWAA
ncbi:hypothetical protein COEX109129_15310 [Corallococcus exiguus]